MRLVAIPRDGHACGLDGHCDDSDKPKEQVDLGQPDLPDGVFEPLGGAAVPVLQVLLQPNAAMPYCKGQFCKDADFNCWGHLNVKDN